MFQLERRTPRDSNDGVGLLRGIGGTLIQRQLRPAVSTGERTPTNVRVCWAIASLSFTACRILCGGGLTRYKPAVLPRAPYLGFVVFQVVGEAAEGELTPPENIARKIKLAELKVTIWQAHPRICTK